MITYQGGDAQPLNLNVSAENGPFNPKNNTFGVSKHQESLVIRLNTVILHQSAMSLDAGSNEIQSFICIMALCRYRLSLHYHGRWHLV